MAVADSGDRRAAAAVEILTPIAIIEVYALAAMYRWITV
jgi:hypothetical protein